MKRSELKTTELVCEKEISPCKAPLVIPECYPLICNDGDMPEITKLEISDKPAIDDNKKQSTKRVKIRVKFSIARLMQASVDFDYEKIDETNVKKTKK